MPPACMVLKYVLDFSITSSRAAQGLGVWIDSYSGYQLVEKIKGAIRMVETQPEVPVHRVVQCGVQAAYALHGLSTHEA